MKTIRLVKTNELKYVEDTVPKKISSGMLLIRTAFCGICGSDLHRIRASQEEIDKLSNTILGHEVIGQIERKATDVKGFSIKDYVAINPLISCKSCNMCRKGWYEHCENLKSIGKELPGGFAEYFIIPATNAYKLNNKMSVEELKSFVLADVVSVCVHAVNLVANIKNNAKAIIIGDGPVGIVLAFYITQYTSNVTLIGKHAYLKSILNEFHINYVALNSVNQSYLNQYDYVFEAVGGRSGGPLNLAISLAHKKGKIVVLGVYDKNKLIGVSLRDTFFKELEIIGSNSYGLDRYGNDEFKIGLNFINKHKREIQKLITHQFKPEECNLALDIFANKKKSIKVIFDFT